MQTKYITYVSALCALLMVVSPLAASAQSVSSGSTTSSATALNWSGYVADIGSYTQITGSWVIPTVTTTNDTSADATWVGIGGVLSHDLIQAGTEAVPDSNGDTDYEAWYELLPDNSQVVPLTIHPGDSVSVSIALQSATTDEWSIDFNDSTTGQSYQTTVMYASSLSSAEWIEEMPAGVGERISLDDFGTIDFSDGSTMQNGTSETIADSGAQALTMQNQNGEPTAVPSSLGTDGMSFTVERTTAASSSIGIGVPSYATRAYQNYAYGNGGAHETSRRFRVYLEPNGFLRISRY